MRGVDYLSQMSPDVFIKQITYLPFKDVISVCLINRKINSYCNDPKYKNIWKSLIDNTFGDMFNYEEDIKKIWEKYNYPPSTYNYIVYTQLINLLDPITQLIIYYKQNDMESFNDKRFNDKERFLTFFLLNNKQKAEKYLPNELYQPFIDLMEGKKLSQDILDRIMMEFIGHQNVLGVSLMLQKGADTEKLIYGFKGHPLYDAVQKGDFKMVKFLVNSGADFIENEIINEAIEEGNLDMVKYLYNKGATIDDVSLEYAVWPGNIEVLKYLLDIKDFNKDILNYNLELNSNYTYPHNGEVVEILVKGGADINYNNGSPLTVAAANNNMHVVKSLIENGANVNINNEAPLLGALETGNLDMVKLIIEAGANIHAIDEYTLREITDETKTELIDYLNTILS